MDDRIKKLIPIAAVTVVVLGLAAFVFFSMFSSDDEDDAIGDNMDMVEFFDHFAQFNPDQILINLEGVLMQPSNAPRIFEGEIYLPVDFLREHVDRYIFWEPGTERLTISTHTEISRFAPGSDYYTINWQNAPLNTPIRQLGDMAYMNAHMVMERYPVFLDFQPEYNILVMAHNRNQQLIYTVIAHDYEDEIAEYEYAFSEPVRFGASRQQPILTLLEPGDEVFFVANSGDFYLVRLQNGTIGYILSENIMFTDFIDAVPQYEPIRHITRPGFDGYINLAWDLFTSSTAAANTQNWNVLQGVNVMSPTWLYFSRDAFDGTMINFGNREYVAWAHNNGKEVWPMVSDAFWSAQTGPENFSNEAARLVLMDATIRDHVINQLMDMMIRYNWDGINIDYEAVREPETDYFIQFLRELSVPMAEAGKVLSVAVFVPTPTNIIRWNYTEIGRAVDFLTIMGYDEHWAGASNPYAGSVSSFNFVRNAVTDMIDQDVRPEQIVLGLPTYMRVWTEQRNDATGVWELLPHGPGGQPLPEFYPYRRVRDVGMQFGRNIITGMGGTFEWDYETRQYVSRIYHTHNGVELRTSAWLNCLRSTSEKLTLIPQHSLGGVAWWRAGLELPTLWDMVDRTLN